MSDKLVVEYAILWGTTLVVRIVEQPDAIKRREWEFERNGFMLASTGRPQINVVSNTLYVRGDSPACDYDAVACTFADRLMLDEYVADMLAAIRAFNATLEPKPDTASPSEIEGPFIAE